MILVGPFQVGNDDTSVLDVVRSHLQDTGRGLVSEATWRALADEIWAAPTNAHLQGIQRDPPPNGAASAADYLLYGDEWIYLPAIPPEPYILERARLAAGADAAAVAKADATSKNLYIPGDAVTDAQLADIPFNVAARAVVSSSVATDVFYYTVPSISTVVDAVPTTTGPVQTNQAFGTPRWLPILWHQIDRFHQALDTHRNALQDLRDIHGAAQVMVAILAKMDRYLEAYEKLEGNQINLVNLFQVQARTLSQVIQRDLAATNVPPAQYQKVLDAWAAVEAIHTCPELTESFAEFALVRERYPATSHALDLAVAAYVVQGANTDGAADAIATKAVATLDLKAQDGVAWKHACDTISLVSTATGAFAATLGNTPGPPTLSVALMKVAAFAKLATADFDGAAKVTNKVFLWVAEMRSMHATSIVALAVIIKARPDRGRALRQKVEEWDIWKKVQSGRAGLSGAVGVFDLFMLVNDLCATRNDVADGEPWYTITGDVAAAGGQAVTTAGAAAQVLTTWKSTAKWPLVESLCGKAGGRIIGVASLIVAVMDLCAVVQGDTGKIAEMAGNLLVGLDPFLPLVISRLWPSLAKQAGTVVARLLLRSAAQSAAGEFAGAVTAEAAGEGAVVLIGAEAIASALSLVGGAILLAVLIIQNWQAIVDATVPKPGQLCRKWLQGIAESQAFAVGPQSLKDAMANCIKAYGNAKFAPLNGVIPGVRESLAKAGLDPDDIASIVDMPDPRFAAPMRY